VSARTVEYRPARSLYPAEYARVAEVFQSVGYAPSGMMIEPGSVNAHPVYFFYGESDADIVEQGFNIRDRIFFRIAGYLTVKISDATAMRRHGCDTRSWSVTCKRP
jgi:hypothetical protein